MSNTDTSPLIEAFKVGDIVECRRLIESEKADIHQKDCDGWSPIIWGFRRGHVDIVDLLLSKGADIHDKEDNYGYSPILYASYLGHVNVVDLLLSKEANIHDKHKHGWSPIIYASHYGYANVVDLLLSKGASLQDSSDDGNTCFSYARNHSDNPYPYHKHGVLYRLHKWPTTMAILVMTELALYHQVETDSLKDLHHFLGIPDDEDGGSYILDSEEMYRPIEDDEEE